MTKELFWIISLIISGLVFIVTVVNIFITSKTSLKISRVNQKLSVDFKLHEALMNQIAVFLATIDERKMNILSINASDPSELITMKKNQEELEVAYNKLVILSNYSNTDF